MSRHCFTYGSLMCEDIMRAVTGFALAGTPAELADHARHPVAGEAYPGMRPAPGGRVQGVLYRDLPRIAFARLDAFEGEQYTREEAAVALPDGRRVAAFTYVFKPQYASLLLPGDWDFEAFLKDGKRIFEARYLGFSRIER